MPAHTPAQRQRALAELNDAVAAVINHANGLLDLWEWGLNAEMDRMMAILRDDLAKTRDRYGRPILPLSGPKAPENAA